MPHRQAFEAAPAVRAGLGLALILLAAHAGHAGQPDPISWRVGFAEARAEARATRRPIWLQFTGPWCGYCRQMERETFARPDVAALSRRRLVPVQARPDEDAALAQHFGISAVPATILLSPDGEVLARHDGYADPGTFLALLNRAPEPSPPDSGRDGVALAGYCPVRLVQDGKLEAGRPAFAIQHEGHKYWFADEATRDAFRKNPTAYLPADEGRCPVHRVDRKEAVAGHPGRGVLYRGRLYLCGDDEARAKFAADPERYANRDVADRGYCPHCLARGGEHVRGLPRYAASIAGRRYFFAGPDHLEAFRADSETIVR